MSSKTDDQVDREYDDTCLTTEMPYGKYKGLTMLEILRIGKKGRAYLEYILEQRCADSKTRNKELTRRIERALW